MGRLDNARKELVKNWLSKARDDLEVAQYLLDGGDGHHAIICFHAQQAAEKAIKISGWFLVEQCPQESGLS